MNTHTLHIAFVRKNHFLSRAIRFFMMLYVIVWKKPHPDRYYSHTDIIMDGLVIGAQARGIVATSMKRALF